MTFLDPIFATPAGALLIAGLRMIDVSMATFRTIMAVRGRRLPATVLGFFQMLFWLMAVAGALRHMDSVFHVLGYAGGFALGNYLGVWLEQRLAIGTSVVRAVFHNDPEQGRAGGPHVAKILREQEFAVTQVPARGWRGDVDVLNVVVPRRQVPEIVQTVEEADPEALVSVDEIEVTRGSSHVLRARASGDRGLFGWRRAA